VIKISKTVLSGAAPGHIREQTEGLAPAQLRELAVQLAADPDLTVSVIAYDDGRQELEVLHTGPPHRTAPSTPSTAAGSSASPPRPRPGRCPWPLSPRCGRPPR
jgi:hypothetical protein